MHTYHLPHKRKTLIKSFIDSIPLNSSLKPDSSLFKLQHLRNLTLRDCNLSGDLPSSLGNLSHLAKLHLSKNYLVGEIPVSFGNLNQLRDLSLADNQFSGNIPFSFANFTQLSQIIISLVRNLFFRSFPTSLFMNPLLGIVSLRNNQFKGPIEFRNTSSFSKLHILFLQQNKFNGHIPKSISKISNLKNLDLHDNNFTGSVPNLANLEYLDLSYNKLEGEIPGSLGDMLELMLSHNSFSSFGNQWILVQIVFEDHYLVNSFGGSIPQCLRDAIVDLTALNLQTQQSQWNSSSRWYTLGVS
ncbi:unnamed protein product [Brassica rapa subsp. trilocularis]